MKRVTNQSNQKSDIKETTPLKKIWHFLWYEESVWSWLANIVIAFILIKFIVYPALSFMLSTSLPIVAVVSGSMEHKIAPQCEKYLGNGLCASYSNSHYDLCGTSFTQSKSVNSTFYWQTCGQWYDSNNISKNTFSSYAFSNGFNTGDVMVVRGKDWSQLQVGDVIVWIASDRTPIIHRVVSINTENNVRTVATKGDHNVAQISSGARSELHITSSQYAGVAVLRIPYIGYVKLWAARAVGYFLN